MSAKQLSFHKKSLIKVLLRFMKLNQFWNLTNQFMLDLLFLNWVTGWCIIFHYNFVKTIFDANLVFTDTDSLPYEIKSEDVHKKSFKHKNLFDFSEYQSISFDLTNKIVIDKIKDEHKGIPINEFVGLKLKMFFLKIMKNLIQQKHKYCNWV